MDWLPPDAAEFLAQGGVIPVTLRFYSERTRLFGLMDGMARRLRRLGEQVVADLDAAWVQPQADWARQRLMVMRLVAQHELTAEQIAVAAGVTRKTVFNYLARVEAEGGAGLLRREHKGGKTPMVRGAVAEEFVAKLGAGKFRRTKDAQAWFKKRTRKTLGLSGVYKVLGKLGARLKVPRKAQAKKNAAKTEAFKAELAARLDTAAGVEAHQGQRVRVGVLDEHRYGLLPVIRRVGRLQGVRVHAPHATRYPVGLPARDAGSGCDQPGGTAFRPVHRSRHPCLVPDADRSERLRGAACRDRRPSRLPPAAQ